MEEVLLVGKLAIEAEELLLLFGERLDDWLMTLSLWRCMSLSAYADINLILLMWVHGELRLSRNGCRKGGARAQWMKDGCTEARPSLIR